VPKDFSRGVAPRANTPREGDDSIVWTTTTTGMIACMLDKHRVCKAQFDVVPGTGRSVYRLVHARRLKAQFNVVPGTEISEFLFLCFSGPGSGVYLLGYIKLIMYGTEVRAKGHSHPPPGARGGGLPLRRQQPYKRCPPYRTKFTTTAEF